MKRRTVTIGGQAYVIVPNGEKWRQPEPEFEWHPPHSALAEAGGCVMKAREREGWALDRAVAQITGIELNIIDMPSGPYIGIKGRTSDGFPRKYSPSTDWSQGGPLIEQHSIELMTNTGEQHGEHERWFAVVSTSAIGSRSAMGPTPLVAAMRALVFAKLGEQIDLPEGLQ